MASKGDKEDSKTLNVKADESKTPEDLQDELEAQIRASIENAEAATKRGSEPEKEQAETKKPDLPSSKSTTKTTAKEEADEGHVIGVNKSKKAPSLVIKKDTRAYLSREAEKPKEDEKPAKKIQEQSKIEPQKGTKKSIVTVTDIKTGPKQSSTNKSSKSKVKSNDGKPAIADIQAGKDSITSMSEEAAKEEDDNEPIERAKPEDSDRDKPTDKAPDKETEDEGESDLDDAKTNESHGEDKPEASDKIDAISDEIKSKEKKKKDAATDQQEVKVFDTKKYHLPIKPSRKHHKKQSLSPWIVIIVILAGLLIAYALVDLEIIDVGLDPPIDLL